FRVDVEREGLRGGVPELLAPEEEKSPESPPVLHEGSIDLGGRAGRAPDSRARPGRRQTGLLARTPLRFCEISFFAPPGTAVAERFAMLGMHRCSSCDGFIPAGRERCPNCTAALPARSRARSLATRL